MKEKNNLDILFNMWRSLSYKVKVRLSQKQTYKKEYLINSNSCTSVQNCKENFGTIDNKVQKGKFLISKLCNYDKKNDNRYISVILHLMLS